MKQKNYYDILGVSENASGEEIKAAYRKLAKQYHPDRNAGNAAAESKFKEINEAHEVLQDPEKRRKYDQLRRYSSQGFGGGGQSMSYEDFMRTYGGETSDTEFSWGFTGMNLEDIFASIFGGRQSRSGSSFRTQTRQTRSPSAANEPQPSGDPFFKRKGNDAYVDIPINLAQAVLGSKLRVRTPSGKSVYVRIPKGTQPEAILRVRGMGFSSNTGTGDLYIRTHLKIPASLTPQQEQEFAQLVERWNMKY